jgi:hypothetical protein
MMMMVIIRYLQCTTKKGHVGEDIRVHREPNKNQKSVSSAVLFSLVSSTETV